MTLLYTALPVLIIAAVLRLLLAERLDFSAVLLGITVLTGVVWASMRGCCARAASRRARRRARSGAGARAGHGRLRAQLLPGGAGGAGAALVPVRALPHPLGLDDADAARRGLHLRQQVRLRAAPAGAQHARSSRSASRSAATSWCSAGPSTPPPTSSSAWWACRATTSRCATTTSRERPAADVAADRAALQRRLLRELRDSRTSAWARTSTRRCSARWRSTAQPVLPGCNRRAAARLRVRR